MPRNLYTAYVDGDGHVQVAAGEIVHEDSDYYWLETAEREFGFKQRIPKEQHDMHLTAREALIDLAEHLDFRRMVAEQEVHECIVRIDQVRDELQKLETIEEHAA